MFLPGARSEWTVMTRPPLNYRLDSAVGTSYGLDFTALTAVLMSLLNQQDDRAAWDDHSRLLESITRLGEKVRVLVQRAQIHGEVKASNKLFTLFDRMVEEVQHENGNFHPKIWVFKYLPRMPVDTGERTVGKTRKPSRSDAIYRFLCTSRNLTLNSNWEAVFCLEGRVTGPGEDDSPQMARNVADFFETAFNAIGSLPKAIQSLIQELKQVTFSTKHSKAVQACEFVYQWPGKLGLFQGLEAAGKSALIVSPFVGRRFLEQLAKKFTKLIVISRQDELDRFWDEAVERLIPRENVWIVQTGEADQEGLPALELHAKLLFCEYGKRGATLARTVAWLGSANATPSAWGLQPTSGRMNCEAMVRFSPGIRPAQFLEQFAYRGGDNEVLNGWIAPYQPGNVEEPDEEKKAEESLEELKSNIAAHSLYAKFERSGQWVTLTLKTSEADNWAVLFKQYDDFLFEICPLGLADGENFRNLSEIVSRGIAFEQMTMAQVGTLVMIRLTHKSTKRVKCFSVKAMTEMGDEFWDERRMAFLKEYLSARDFREFLRSILFGEPLIRSGGVPENVNEGVPDSTYPKSWLDDFTVEDILHACTGDRSKIDEIDALLKAFEGTDHVDAPFLKFWENFRQAVRAREG